MKTSTTRASANEPEPVGTTRAVGSTLLAAAAAVLALAAPATAGTQTGETAAPAKTATAASSATGMPSAAEGSYQAQEKLVEVWASDVNMRVEPYLDAPSPTTFGPGNLVGFCQRKGDPVSEPGQGSGSWWTHAELPGGSDRLFISNVYLKGGEKIEGIPDC